MAFTLPALPYAHNALEPHIDELTMQIHHGKHHQAYVDNLNKAIAGTANEGKSLEELVKAGATIRAHDPEGMENVKKMIGNKIQYFDSPYWAAENADALFIATEWPEFRTPDFEKLASLLKNKVIFDGRNLYDLGTMRELGFVYHSIGREGVNV